MADPSSHTTRQDPTSNGNKLDDGFSTKVALAADPDIEFWEKTVTPPGFDGGDPIDTTTMFNSTWRTKKPRQLVSTTDIEITAAYDPDVYDQIAAVINVETTITVTFSDGTQLTVFGYLRVFEPQSVEEGSQPEANITLTITNWDPAAKVEGGYMLTETSGT